MAVPAASVAAKAIAAAAAAPAVVLVLPSPLNALDWDSHLRWEQNPECTAAAALMATAGGYSVADDPATAAAAAAALMSPLNALCWDSALLLPTLLPM